MDAPYTVSAFLKEIGKAVTELSYMPRRNPLIRDAYVRRREYRKCIVKKYIILYTISEEELREVYIYRIFHSRQSRLDILE